MNKRVWRKVGLFLRYWRFYRSLTSNRMLLYSLLERLDQFSAIQKLLWSVAIVASLLVLIQVFLSFFGREADKPSDKSGRYRLQAAGVVLLFFTFFAWASILANLWQPNILHAVTYGLPVGFLAAVLPVVLLRLKARGRNLQHSAFDLKQAITSTGEVCQYISSGADGRTGKVHLNLKNAPRLVDAVSNGQDIPVGAPIRVVEIRGDRVVVEPITGGLPPNLPS